MSSRSPRPSARDGDVARFEAAVEAVISGDLTALRSMLRDHPELARARSTRRHHATLLHYLGANGVEGGRQKTPPNAVEIAKTLLDAGAEVDALADMYDARCTTMSMLVSSSSPGGSGSAGGARRDAARLRGGTRGSRVERGNLR